MSACWNGRGDIPDPAFAPRIVTLTRKGLIAALCAAAEPYDWTRKAGDEEEGE